MEDFFAWLQTPYTYVLIFISATSIIAAAIFQDIASWVRNSIFSGGKRALGGILHSLKRIFSWCGRETKEWKRVSAYRHHILTWDDLPEGSKSKVGFQDLKESARHSMSFKDLSLNPKFTLLKKFILPNMYSSQHSGSLHKVDEQNYPVSSRSVQISVIDRGEITYTEMSQDGMTVWIDVEFMSPGQEITLQRGDRVWFEGEWQMVGEVLQERPIGNGKYNFAIWVDMFHCEGLVIYEVQK